MDEPRFRTPTAQLAVNGGSQHPDKRKAGGHGPTLADELEHLLPTPKTGDNRASRVALSGANSERHGRTPAGSRSGIGLEQAVELSQGMLPREFDSWEDVPTALFPTPRATDGTKGGPNQRGSSGDLMLPSAVQLLPTPAVNDMGEGKSLDWWDEWTARMKETHANGNGHGPSLAIEAQRLSSGDPTPPPSDDGSEDSDD
jgi:hypothetical protein